MENSNVKENLEVLFEKFKNMIKVETVVGEAVQIGDTTLIGLVPDLVSKLKSDKYIYLNDEQ